MAIENRALSAPGVVAPSTRAAEKGKRLPTPFLADVADGPLACDDDANASRVRLARSRHAAEDALGVARRARQDEADTHVKRPVHLVAADGTALLNELKNGRYGPRVHIDFRGAPFRKHARDVLRNPAASNVGQALGVLTLEERPDHRQVTAVRRK